MVYQSVPKYLDIKKLEDKLKERFGDTDFKIRVRSVLL